MIETLSLAWSDVAPDTFRNSFRRTGFTTELIQSASLDQDVSIGELCKELTNVPDDAPKEAPLEGFLSVNDLFAVTVKPPGTDSVAYVRAAGAAESTEKTEDAPTSSHSMLYEALFPIDVLRQCCFDIERHGLNLVQTMSRAENAVVVGPARMKKRKNKSPLFCKVSS